MLFKDFLKDATCEDTIICISPASKWNKWIEVKIDNDSLEGPEATSLISHIELLGMEIENWRVYLGFENKVAFEIALYMTAEEEEWFLGLEEIRTMGEA